LRLLLVLVVEGLRHGQDEKSVLVLLGALRLDYLVNLAGVQVVVVFLVVQRLDYLVTLERVQVLLLVEGHDYAYRQRLDPLDCDIKLGV